jgi:hypothetical protein
MTAAPPIALRRKPWHVCDAHAAMLHAAARADASELGRKDLQLCI